MKRTLSFPILIILFLLSCAQYVFAGGPPVKMLLSGVQLKPDSSVTIADPVYAAYRSQLTTPYRINNKITLKLNSAVDSVLESAFSAKIRFRVTDSTFGGTIRTTDTSLTINYSLTTNYITEASYFFTGAYNVKVEILEVISDVSWNVWRSLQLENEMQSFPVFNFDCEENIIQNIYIHAPASETEPIDELSVSWANIPAADEYDLEWTFLDQSAIDSGWYLVNSAADVNNIFENNSSRVSVTGTSYKIPMLYDGAGHVILRVRAVQYQADGRRTEGRWNTDESGTFAVFQFNGHERSLNWQATTSFAEEGKRKSVVQYYDGSLRSRQTVTKDNSTNTTIVGESIYDFQGRPVIQVMPAPTLSNLISYSRNFNVGLSGNAYDKEDFDVLDDSSLYCNTSAKPMKTDSGSARYYSPENPDFNIGINRFIPDAEGYPFTEVQYTQDNTGRIKSQSGVGPNHRLSSGHETQYYYGTPDQEDLDALFGTEAGDRSHYFKNMVRDANGQYSVSYVDMHGRTIATALAGVPATKMNPDGISSFLWTKVSGGPGTIHSPNNASTSVSGLTEGVHVFRLTLTDQLGTAETSDVTITVNTTPGAPTANAGSSQNITLPTSSVTLNGTASIGGGGTSITQQWTKLSGGTAVITNSTNLSTTVTGLQAGTYVFRLTVTDNTGAVAASEVEVKVYPAASSLEITRFNFSKTAAAVAGWMNVTGNPDLAVVTATNSTTGVSISSVATANWYPYSAGSGTSSNAQGALNGTFFTAAVLRNHWFQYNTLNASYNPAKPQLEISGLTPGTPYTLRMSASSFNSFISNTRYRVAGDKVHVPVDINTYNNTANGAVFANILPDPAGKIRVYVNTIVEENTNLANISGIEIIKSSPDLSVSVSGDQVIRLPIDTVRLTGIAIDPMATITNYTWSKVSGGTATIVSSTSSSTKITGLQPGNYLFRLRVRNSTGATAANDVRVIVYPEGNMITAVGFNFTDTNIPIYVDGWTNLSGDPHVSVITARDPISGISLTSVNTANWSPYTAGSGTASNGSGVTNGTFFPATVMRNHWFQYRSSTSVFDSTRPQLELSGLTPGTPYTIKMTGSQVNPFSSLTRYRVAGLTLSSSIDIDTKNNVSNGAVFNDIVADYAGKIRIYVNNIASPLTDLASINGVQVIVNNMPPVVDAGSNRTITLPTKSIILSGAGMDPETGNAKIVTRKLTDSTNNIVSGTTIKSAQSLLVPVAGVHTFTYSLNPDSVRINDCNNTPICYDCLYDLRITISDDCNNQKLGGRAFDTTLYNFSFAAIDTLCNTPQDFSFTFNKFLEEGNYEITKSLTISKYAQDYYRDSIFLVRNHCKTVETFIQEQRAILAAITDCKPSCQSCLTSLGTWESFRANFMLNAGIENSDTINYRGTALHAYQEAEAACKALCGTTSEVDEIRAAMLSDLTPPTGQYANPEKPDDIHNIFHADIKPVEQTSKEANYTKPLYLNDAGDPDFVYDERANAMVAPGSLSIEDFVQKFNSSWAEALLQYHPEYSKLLKMQNLIASYEWDTKFSAVDSYQEAMKRGYLNPTNNQNSPYNRFNGLDTAYTDPLADSLSNTENTFKAKLEAILQLYKNSSDSSSGLSLWGLATGLTLCNDTSNLNCFANKGHIDSAFNTTSMCEGDLDMAWRNFRQLYLDAKKHIITKYISVCPPNTATCIPSSVLLDSAHQPHFGNAIEFLHKNGLDYVTNKSNPQGSKQQALNEMAQYYEDNCRANAARWWKELKPCNYSPADSAMIMERFVQVCKEGSDIDHPFGSSTVKPSSTYNYRSFEQIMKEYSSSTYNANCNVYLLTAIKPYEQQSALTNVAIWRKPDSCQCTVINNWYQRYQTAGSSDSTFAAYLKRVANTDMSNGALDTLRQLCNDQITCEYLPAPISLSPAMQCGVKDVCVDCETYAQLNQQFIAEFPGVTLYANPGTEDSALIRGNKLFTRFMNQNLGFEKNEQDYIEFSKSCGLKFADDSNKYLIDIVESYKNTRLSNSRWSYVGNNFHITDINQLIGDGYFRLPTSFHAQTSYCCVSPVFFNNGKICAPSGYSLEARVKTDLTRNITLATYPGDSLYGGVFAQFLSNGSPSTYSTYVQDGKGRAVGAIPGTPLYQGSLVDWHVLKCTVTPTQYLLYVDNVLVKSYNRPQDLSGSVGAITGFYISFAAMTGLVDWVRLSSNGDVLLFEDFNDPANIRSVDKGYVCPAPDCKESFATYFNQQRGTAYTYQQIDSVYYSTFGYRMSICGTPTDIDSGQLKSVLNEYNNQYIQPKSGIVDLDMRTFAGNITPAAGPKGVFNVNDEFIGNTVDSTVTEINKSYAQLWNSDSANIEIGYLSPLNNGKFRLQLKPGKLAPSKGITGMRYYQFDALVKDTMHCMFTSMGSYINFGDGTNARVLSNPSTDSLTDINHGPPSINGSWGITYDENGKVQMGLFYEKKWVMGSDYIPLTRFQISHIFPHTTEKTSYTVTVYHSDYKGQVGFEDHQPAAASTQFKNLKGYFPQNLLEIIYRGTRDSSISSTNRIKNFSSINSIQHVEMSYLEIKNGGTTTFKFNNFGSFANNRGMKRLRLEGPYFYKNSYTTADSLLVDSIAGKHFTENFPNLKVNFPELRSLILYGWVTRETDVLSLNFELPKLKVFSSNWHKHPVGFFDTVYNQLARRTTIDTGIVFCGYPSYNALPTSASATAKSYLQGRGWEFEDGVSCCVRSDGPDDIVSLDTLPVSNAFAELFNQKFRTNYSIKQIDSIYEANNVSLNTPSCDTCSSNFSGPLLCGKSEPIFPTVRLADIDNCTDSTFFAVSKGTELYKIYYDSLTNHFDSTYLTKCLQAYKYESFTVTRPNSEYHYTLYYYDQAGNLVKTVPPAGVDESKFYWSKRWSDSVSQARNNHTLLTPTHTLITQYRYNTLNQVVAQQTPDAGKSQFWYDRLGRLVLSQNAKQKAASGTEQNRLYSYTEYDYLGRIKEVGEIKNATTTPITESITRIPVSLQEWLTSSVANKSQITSTVYDLPYLGFDELDINPLFQSNLRNRVSYTSYTQGSNPALFNQASFYSYDIHGNVDTLLQDYGKSDEASVANIMNTNENRFKKIVYRYDLISGKVNHVAYQPGEADQFYHRYEYDAENRLIELETSLDSVIWQKDARYEYYKHGPLARTVLGNDLVQGLDYAYTLQGWLKGVNSTQLNPDQDMGGDGQSIGQHRFVARDVYGFNLNYFDGDYKPIDESISSFANINSDHLQASYRPLYNGNISSMAVNIGKFSGPHLYNYKYDRLNRLTQMDTWKGYNANGNNWSGISISEDFKERIAYDPNGNILRYLRFSAGQTSPMDSMRYNYYANTNRLSHINDNAHPAIEGLKDIEDQPGGNYSYDEIGNLVGDISENISNGSIQWNVYGKIASITRTAASGGNNTKQIVYNYDAAGNRIGKKVTTFGSSEVSHTWYVRDASGNVMAVYTAKKDTASSNALSDFALTLSEQHLYGSSRLGVLKRDQSMEGTFAPGNVLNYTAGLRQYQLSNHLGNVLATVSDKKIGVASLSNSSLIDHYRADVQSAQDYYPFGMLMPGRTFSAGGYRYGFNGKEMDNDVKGEGNQIAYENRIYDPRIGRWHSLDPLQKKYPGESHYAFVSNSPMVFADKKGLDKIIYLKVINQDGTVMTVATKRIINNQVNFHIEETYNGPTAFFTDVKQTITLDLRTQKSSVSGLESDYSSQYSFFEGLDKKIGSSVSNGKQGGGWTFTSEFSNEVDPVKTKATKGSSGAVNVDALLAMMGAVTKEAKIPQLLVDLGPAEFSNTIKELTTAIKDVLETNNNKGADKKSMVFKREDDFVNEKKGSVQDHAYAGDTTTSVKESKDNSGVDTFYIKRTDKTRKP